MNPINYKTTYYTKETELAGFAPFPHYLLKLELSMTARVLYSQLLNRAKLSLQSGWMDECGRVYVYFSEAEIGETGIIQVVSTIPESYPGHSLLTEDEGCILGEDDCPCGRKGKYFKINGRLKNAEIRGCSDTYAELLR